MKLECISLGKKIVETDLNAKDFLYEKFVKRCELHDLLDSCEKCPFRLKVGCALRVIYYKLGDEE